MVPPVESLAPCPRATGVRLLAYVNRSLKEFSRRHRQAFRRCQKEFSEDAVHDLRVETRRLLALLNLLHIFIAEEHLEEARRLLKRLLKRLARLRDTQVQLRWLQPKADAFPEAVDFRQALQRRERRLIKRLDRRLKKARVNDVRDTLALFRKELNRQLKSAETQAADWVKLLKAVRAAFARVQALRQQMDPRRLETIHRTRVAFKKFRYLVELLHPLLPHVTRRQLRAMHAYQSMMGDIQDTDVMLATLDKFARKSSAAAGDLQALRKEVVRRQAARVRTFLAAADRLDGFWPAARRSPAHPS